jgi:hypothetical protein
MTEEHKPEMPPVKIAFVIDDKVVDVLHTDERLASIFLSDPLIIDATDWYTKEENKNLLLLGGTWNGEKLIGTVHMENTPLPVTE